jgi:hypothetical protein
MQKLRPLDDVLTDYAKAEKLSKKNLDSVPEASRAGHATAIRQAKDKLPGLRVEYLTAILKNAVGFFPEGSPERASQFAAIASENGAFDIDAAAIFNALADEVQTTMGGKREFSVTQVGRLDQALKSLVEKAGYTGPLTRTTISKLQVVPNREKLVEYIRELVVRHNGSTASVVSAQSDLVAKAMKAGFNGKRLVAVVRNATSVDRAALAGLFTKVVKVDVDGDEPIDERFARDTIMGALKPAKPAVAPTKAEDSSSANQNQNTQENT